MGQKLPGKWSSETTSTDTESEVTFILEHPDMSGWLKDTLREALPRDRVAVLNDLEILNRVLRDRP